MATPTYIAQNVGNEYKLQPKYPPIDQPRYFASTVLGGGLLLRGLARRGFFGGMSFLVGGFLLYYGLTGQSLLNVLDQYIRAGQSTAKGASPHRHPGPGGSRHRPADLVEEQSMESFPASDAPSSTVVRP